MAHRNRRGNVERDFVGAAEDNEEPRSREADSHAKGRSVCCRNPSREVLDQGFARDRAATTRSSRAVPSQLFAASH